MHVTFTDEELEWIDTRTMGWPIKKGCPKKIRDSILEKKKLLEWQKDVIEGRRDGHKRNGQQ